jgi:hypothetical protein
MALRSFILILLAGWLSAQGAVPINTAEWGYKIAGSCVTETPLSWVTSCVKNVPNSTYAGTCSSPSFGVCAADPPESCIANVPTSVYSGGCFSASPGLCNPTIGAVDYYSCVKNVPDSVYSGACFSPEKGICNATTGSADNRYCTGSTIKRSEFCAITFNSRFCTAVNTPFVFTAVKNAAKASVFTSNGMTLNGLSGTLPISVSGGTYSIDGQPFTSASGMVSSGSSVTLRQISSSQARTQTSTFLTIGPSCTRFDVMTRSSNPTPILMLLFD